MKNISISKVVRTGNLSRLQNPIHSWRQLGPLALTLALGLLVLMVAFHLIDPSAPLGYIVPPVLVGGLVPVLVIIPGRFEITTRFDARLMVVALDESLSALGYAPAGHGRGAVRYRSRQPGWLCKEIAVTVRDHALEVIGPVDALRALHKRIAY